MDNNYIIYFDRSRAVRRDVFIYTSNTFDFCLSTSIPVLTTSTYVVAWPQGDQLLGGGPWHKANLPTTQ